jgi:CheY-like chemotaxis protein
MADILIAEDVDVQATLIRRYLEGAHTVVDVVTTDDDAVEAVRATSPDAVVMDLNLQRGDGIDATEAIRGFDSGVAIVVSTVSVDEEAQERAFEAGADEYLVKPYRQQELLDAVESAIG